ncbi:Esterase/lipase superfamily enzyme [Ruegeria halocynthiae]|uniref:Esterase/lipase superfamily enzyme n=1 Tax=Ruegeria halocynthiae TaxID=985054 RepID=A0A1H3BG29_9RHOB|nr:alpha/beta fold hydrolase [Ruegeria halocynthiae]SDX40940.1 Esterase/lipase superfamily enzyme [Ruegeria halocynthiae]
MLRYLIIIASLCLLSACADRTITEITPEALKVGTPATVFAATTRAREGDGSYGSKRAEALRYLELTVSIPPTHTPGTLEFSYANPNPKKQFVLADVTEFSGRQDLKSRLHGVDDVVIFVHGYNATQTETAFRAAQLSHDIGIPGTILIYSWPSQARGIGYAYDLDSMLFARDGLEQTIRFLRSSGVKRVILIAHSMGGALSMEMMRQAELREPGWSNRNIEGVILISPDLDVDLFRSQMNSIKEPPDPFVVMVSKKDKILNVSARLRGTADSERLGNISSVDSLAKYPINVIDTTAFNSDAGSSHFVAATSPALLSILSSVRRVSSTFGPDRPGIDVLVPPSERSTDGATEIVLTETGQAQVSTP